MNKQLKQGQGFTLVELIVVITILAILGTIAFISLQGYSSSARNSRRISDINNIKKSLELFQLNTGVYPVPDNIGEVTYSGELVWTQGTIGKKVQTNLSRNLSKIPLDPLLEMQYTYSITQAKTEYQVLGLFEGNLSGNKILVNETYASNKYLPKLNGNYNEVFVKTKNYIIPLPSIITSEEINGGLELNGTRIKSQITTNGKNLPKIGGIKSSTGRLENLSLQTKPIISKDSSKVEKEAVITMIQNVYRGTELENEQLYSHIINTTDKEKLADFILFDKGTGDFLNNNSGVGNGTKIIDFSNSGDFVQEDSINGTVFENGKVVLKNNLINNISSFTPYMNSDTSSEMNIYYSSQLSSRPWNLAFDKIVGGIGTFAAGGESNVWVATNFSNPHKIYKYQISSRTENSVTWTSRDWDLLGSNNSTNGVDGDWDNLDTQSVTWSLGETKEFILDLNNSYDWYKLEFSNAPTSGYSQIAEIDFFEKELQNSYVIGEKYLTTSSQNNLDLTGINKINSVNITSNEPTNTSIKALVSFDGRNTWKKWNGSSWEQVIINVNYSEDLCIDKNLCIENGNYGGRNCTKAFEDNVGGYKTEAWNSDRQGMPCWVGYNFGENKIINKYSVTTLNAIAASYSPKSWIFQGSNDGVNWNDLHTVTDELTWANSEKREFEFDNSNSYKQYRLLISENYRTDSLFSTIGIDEIEMMSLSGTSLDELQNGNTLSEIQEGLTNLEITNETGLDFAFDLKTTDGTVTPEISNIEVYYE